VPFARLSADTKSHRRPLPGQTAAEQEFRGCLAICCLTLLIVRLDTTIVNVALPSIGRELRSRPGSYPGWRLVQDPASW
jgi:hypothetical protein